MKARIARRVMVAVGLVSLTSFGASAWLASRAHERELAALVERQALILSDTIRNSTRHAMLLNEREMVHRIIEQIGRQGGLEKVRVYNKEGEVIYSPDPALIGTTVRPRLAGRAAFSLSTRPTILRMATSSLGSDCTTRAV